MNADSPASDPGSPPETTPERWIDRLRTLFGLRSGSLRTDLAEVLSDEPAKAEFSPAERTMLQNVLDFEQQRVGDIMVPRADIVAVQQEIPIGELLQVFANAAHSRLVAYDDSLDDPVGMVHLRDLVSYLTTRALASPELATRRGPLPREFNTRALNLAEPLSATQIVRRLLFVPPSMPAIDLLVKMQATRIHLALVIDEYGGTDGLVSIEDMVEQIVGDIEDEHDDEEPPPILAQPDGSFIADARAGLEEAAEKVDAAFAADELSEEVETLGGLLVKLAGRVPVRGEIVAGPAGYEFEVLDADPRRVKRLRIYRPSAGSPRREPRRRAADEATSVAPSLPKAAPEPAAPASRPRDTDA